MFLLSLMCHGNNAPCGAVIHFVMYIFIIFPVGKVSKVVTCLDNDGSFVPMLMTDYLGILVKHMFYKICIIS